MLRRAVALLLCATALVSCSGGDDGSAEELCAAVRAAPSLTTAFLGFDPTNTPVALEQLRDARVTLGELHGAAPSEVRGDLSVEIEYVQALIDGLEGVEPGDAVDAVAVVQRVTADHPDVSDAAANLEAYAAGTCA